MMKALIVILFVIYALLVSCTSSKTVVRPAKDEVLNEIQSTIVFNPRTGNYDTVYVRNNKVDTVNWRNPPLKTTAAPIGLKSGATKPGSKNIEQNPKSRTQQGADTEKKQSEGFVSVPKDSKIKSNYQIAYLLPFFSDKFSKLDKDFYEKSKWALNFYAGAKLALDSLDSEHIHLKVDVHDSKANENQLDLLLKNEAVEKADVIIGTETNANVEIAAEYAKKNGKILISPYNPSGEIVSDNRQFVQINPSLRTNCEAIMRHVRKKFASDQIVLLCRNKTNEKEALQYLQLENMRLAGSSGTMLKEFVLDEKGGIAAFDAKSLLNKDNMVFVIPVWGQNSETFVYSVLSKINNAKGKRNVTVYGLPQWSNFQVNVYDIFEPLQVHITQPVYIDKFTAAARAFSALFYSTYGAAPEDEAYIGYDVTLYCGKMLQQYGTKFNEVIDKVPFEGLHTQFKFEKEASLQNKSLGKNDNFDRIANKHVNILTFKNGCFQQLD